MSEQENKANQQESVSSGETKKAKAPKKNNKPNAVVRWFKDLRGELKKVTWPSLQETLKNVGIVIACVLIVGVFIWVFDWLARAVIDALLGLFG